MKFLVLILLAILIFGCAGQKQIKKAEAPGVERGIVTIKQSSEGSLPGIIKQLKSVDEKFILIKEYGEWIEQNRQKGADKLTIYSDRYWQAFLSMSPGNPTVFLSRIFLLISEGSLKKAEYALVFSLYQSSRNDSAKNLIGIIGNQIKQIRKESGQYVELGIKAYDAGDIEKALSLYEKALYFYPKSPSAHYEIGLTYMTKNMGDMASENFDEKPHTLYYEKTRQYDPFFQFAYQGKIEIAKKMLIIMEKIQPVLPSLYKGNIASADLEKFAEGCMEIEAFEFAAYSYHTLLLRSFNKESGFDTKYSEKMAETLRKLGTEKAADFLIEQISEYNKMMAES